MSIMSNKKIALPQFIYSRKQLRCETLVSTFPKVLKQSTIRINLVTFTSALIPKVSTIHSKD